jgi:hypothetical protein
MTKLFLACLIVWSLAVITAGAALLFGGCSIDRGNMRYSIDLIKREDPRYSWDQETLLKQSNVMVCPDSSYVFGTSDGKLKECL